MKTKIYLTVMSVAFISALAGALFARPGIIVGLSLALALAWVGGFYIAEAVREASGRAAARLRRPVAEEDAREDSEPLMEPVATTAAEVWTALEKNLASLTADKQARDLILDNMRDGVLLTDQETTVILANPAAGEIFRLAQSEIVGRPIVHAVPSQELDELVRQVVAERREAEAEIETVVPEQKHLQAVALPVTDGRGLIGVLVVIHDVTSRQLIEAVRKDFVANVSHELKTPVSGIGLLSESILSSMEDDPKIARTFAKKLKRETDRLAQLVRDLLDLSQLEATNIRAISTNVSITDIIKRVADNLMGAAAARGISLRTELPPQASAVAGSESQLELMLRNLIDNAVNYTPTGGDVFVTVGESDDLLTVTVKDTGIGIPQGDRERIFERFYRVDRNRSRETGGTGLGLSIVKHVVDNHGGRITLDSTVGLGSKFIIELPKSGTGLPS